jgi:hypothetical protein
MNMGKSSFPIRNNRFIGLQRIKKNSQRQPMFAAETITALVSKATGDEQMLYALLAGTLGLRVSDISADFRTLTVRQSDWNGTAQEPKTEAALRDVDL